MLGSRFSAALAALADLNQLVDILDSAASALHEGPAVHSSANKAHELSRWREGCSRLEWRKHIDFV